MSDSVSDAYARILAAVPLQLFINSTFQDPVKGGRMAVVDPATEDVITNSVPSATAEDVDLAVAAAKRAFEIWGKTTGAYVHVWLGVVLGGSPVC
jgi:acyl-CoA reductase-like NAD-dependent aldehyde dehydrogenase